MNMTKYSKYKRNKKKRTRWAIVNEMNEEDHGRRNEWDAEKVVR